MFGIGFGKLLLLVAIVVAVWYAFKFVGRLDRKRKRELADKKKTDADSIGKMDQCPTCGTYVVADRAQNCGREGCPY
jgi:ribosomal protein L32